MSNAVWTDQPVGWALYGTQQTENAKKEQHPSGHCSENAK